MAQVQAQRQRQQRIQPPLHPSDYDYDYDYEYTFYNPHLHHRHQHQNLAIERERKLRSRHREDRHAALCVLLDRELLMLQALAMNEVLTYLSTLIESKMNPFALLTAIQTLPQARRRFTSKLMAPEDPADAAAIRADRYTILLPSNTASSTGTGSSTSSGPASKAQHVTVPRSVVDVHETGDAGWVRREGSASEGGVGSATPSPLSKGKNRTPSGGGRMTGSPSQQRRRSGR